MAGLLDNLLDEQRESSAALIQSTWKSFRRNRDCRLAATVLQARFRGNRSRTTQPQLIKEENDLSQQRAIDFWRFWYIDKKDPAAAVAVVDRTSSPWKRIPLLRPRATQPTLMTAPRRSARWSTNATLEYKEYVHEVEDKQSRLYAISK